MPLESGTRLGPYEIVAPLGQGGMGEVYRARDTRLDRTVAIKVLPAALASDAELRARFEREARAISSLQHPNICALFDVGESPRPDANPIQFLVLEYLEGETLAERIAKDGAIRVADALRFAIDICDALDKSHRSGIVHRDLKPANVFLARGGRSGLATAKLLDFGLAKTATPVVAASGLSLLPTTPPGLTAQGTILGTFQYMAPEQIEGFDADARTDIFAFGALLFEMLTGRPAFEGKTRATLLGAILKDDPPLVSSLQAHVSPALDRIVATCLAKDPDDRWQTSRDLLRELKWVPSAEAPIASSEASTTPKMFRRLWPLAAIAVLAAVSGFAFAMWPRPSVSAPSFEFNIQPPPSTTFATVAGGGTGIAAQIAVSPDGNQVVFVANNEKTYQLWLRPLDSVGARPLDGTDGAAFPFWSPDSRFIGFFANGKLKKVAIAGGPALVLCDAPSGRGGTWNRDNVIVFTPGTVGALQRVAAAGGPAVDVSVLDTAYGESNHRFPFFLPDGRHFMFTGTVGTCCPPTKAGRLHIGTLDSRETTILFEVESAVTYADGHLLFNRDGTLMAQPFDVTNRTTTGDPFPIAQSLANEGSRYASFSAANGGVLVVAAGAARTNGRLTWVDRSGRPLSVIGEAGILLNIALAADENRVAAAFASGSSPNRDIWLFDGAGEMTRVTFEPGEDNAPVWSADGTRLVYFSQRDGINMLRQKVIGGTSSDESVFERPAAEGMISPTDWSADGRYLLYSQSQSSAGGQLDIWGLPMLGARTPFPIVQTPASETDGSFSPDGRWIAYSSTENAQSDIYVQPYPTTGAKFQISRGGGVKPVWRRDGRELYYLVPGGALMAVAIDPGQAWQSGAPRQLFIVSTLGFGAVARQYDVTRDGQRFIMNVRPQQSAALPLTVATNWLAAIHQ